MQIKTKTIFLALFLFINLIFFNFSWAQVSIVETEDASNEVKSDLIDNLSPEEKVEGIERADIPEGVKIRMIERIKNPQNEIDKDNLPKISCNDYYNPQGIMVNLQPYVDSAKSKNKIQLIGEVINQNNYPIIDGSIFARISKVNSGHTGEDYVMEEIFLAENIFLKENETKNVEYYLDIRSNMSKGDYRIDYFFLSGKKFNLGGFPFTDGLVAGTSRFSIQSEQIGFIYFDKSKTFINNQKYKYFGDYPIVGSDEGVVIKQDIFNTYTQSREIEITYNLYGQDIFNSNSLKSTREKINIQGNSSQELNYIIPKMDDAVYHLQIIAQSGEDKSIVNIGVSSFKDNIRLVYPAITKFPITKGDNLTLFSCFNNDSSGNTKGRVEVSLEDNNGKEIGSFKYGGDITKSILAEKKDIVSKSDYDYLKIKAKIYNRNDDLIDEYEMIYNCKDFDNCKSVNKNSISNTLVFNRVTKVMLSFGLLLVIITIIVVAIKIRGKKN